MRLFTRKLVNIKLIKSQSGYSLIEILISLVILGLVSVSFVMGLNGSLLAFSKADELQTARTIAEKQMEYVLNLPYDNTSYTPLDMSTDYPGYTINNPTANDLITPTDMVPSTTLHFQKITLTVYHNGKQVFTLDDYKVQR